MKYIDSHAHYCSGQFSKDRDDLILEILNNDVDKIIECGTNVKSNNYSIKLAHKYDSIYAVIGFFPTDVSALEDPKTREDFINLLSDEKVVGIGEIGLDYHFPNIDKALQKKYFIEQLKIAKTAKLPICIHSRDAEIDTVSILKNNGPYTGVIHCYSYGTKTMEILDKLGYYFGVGGTSTYNNPELRDAIKKMPIEKILLETDSPYLTPKGAPSKRNDSSNIKYVIQELAKLKNMSPDSIVAATNDNVLKIYKKIS